ncbi:MAG: leucine-rich repeat domain-containing protein [Pseudonocardiaceae bacterium]
MSVDVDEAALRVDQVFRDGRSSLDLSNLRLRTLPPRLADVTGLTELDLSGNWLAEVPEWISNLTGLTRLDLDNNRLVALPDSLANLTGLTELYLNNNRFAEVPDWISNLTGLTTLSLSNNRLTEIPEWIASLTGLTKLGIGGHSLTEVPEWIANLTGLTTLNLNNNRLAEIPGWIANLTGLTKLGIGGNSFTEVPAWIVDLTGLTTLYLDNNRLTEVPEWISNLTGLTRLDLDNNRLVALPDSLANLTGLTELYLNNNRLVALPDSLANLTGLTELYLNNNRLAEVPEWIASLTGLTKLGIGGYSLAEVPEWIVNLTGLTTLNLNNNRLAALPDGLANLTGLTELYLSDNQLTEVPEWIANLTGLTMLSLSGNQLIEVPEWIANLTGLTMLSLSDNQLTEVPEWIANLTGLTTLSLFNNRLAEVPEWMVKLTGLTTLYLNNNQLTEVPEWVANLTGLTKLGIGGQSLTEIPEWIVNLTGLTDLYLGNSQLTEVPEWIANLTGLTTLSLSDNQLVALPDGLANLTGLTTLSLSNNQLVALPDGLANLTGLTTLDLDNNQLTEVPEWITSLAGLTELDLSGNQLSSLPDWLTELTGLEQLSVHRNPLVSPPPEIAEGGSQSILAFIHARRQGSSTQWVSKLLVVGEGGVGKTSLVKALARIPHDPGEPSTHGLRIEHLRVDHPSQPGVQMRLSAWDFGGQQIYHATHQFFLTDRSLFLLLWNSRLGWEQSKLRYWLDIITAKAPQSPIVMVATHAEGRPVDLPLDELRHEYPRIADNISVDNETRHGVDVLHKLLSEKAAGLPLMGAVWPATWFAAAESLRTSEDKHVTPERMWRMMTEAGVSDAAQCSYIADALHQLGDILYYSEDPELAQTVVLKPEWVNEYISKVLDSEQVAAKHGLLTREHLNELWCDLDRGMRDHFLGMMDKYDLSYRIEGGSAGDVSLVVERLPWNPPPFQGEWDKIGSLPGTQEIKVLYRLNTMPPGIPTWLIARSHRFSKKTHWRSGALFGHTDGRHLALVRADRHRNILELTVRGPSPAAFFSVLDDGMNVTLERFPGLGVTRQVPCQCQRSNGSPCAELFDYDDLDSRRSRTPPRHEIECRKSGELVSVSQLLLGLAPSERDAIRMSIDQITKKLTHLDEMTEQNEYSQRMFLKLFRNAQAQQEAPCPSVFAVVPATRRRFAGSAYELRLYCEEPGAWHRLPEPHGCYPITEPSEWLRKLGPYLQQLLKILKLAAPLAGPILGMSVDKLDQHLKSDCDLMKELVSQAPTRLRYKDELPGINPTDSSPSTHATNEADFRVLEAMLTKIDPDRIWGGLCRTSTPEGLTLYLCPYHLATYQQTG